MREGGMDAAARRDLVNDIQANVDFTVLGASRYMSSSSSFSADQPQCCSVDTDQVVLNFYRTDHTMCPRWHCDQVFLRLLLTYQGPGTQWALTSHTRTPTAAAPRFSVAQWLGSSKTTQTAAAMQPSVDAPQQSDPFDVLVLKGDWFRDVGSGSGGEGEKVRFANAALHRSPEFPVADGEGDGEGLGYRVLLAVDVLLKHEG
uniref:Uncharacterized protein n=1 Tax=Vitrella brassicaformis TaxID=1169539 RepID=A0A7S1K3D0_9ALVE